MLPSDALGWSLYFWLISRWCRPFDLLTRYATGFYSFSLLKEWLPLENVCFKPYVLRISVHCPLTCLLLCFPYWNCLQFMKHCKLKNWALKSHAFFCFFLSSWILFGTRQRYILSKAKHQLEFISDLFILCRYLLYGSPILCICKLYMKNTLSYYALTCMHFSRLSTPLPPRLPGNRVSSN